MNISQVTGTHLKDGDSEGMFEVGVAIQDDLTVVAIEIGARDLVQLSVHPEQHVGGIVWNDENTIGENELNDGPVWNPIGRQYEIT